MKRELLIAALLITTTSACSRKVGKEPPPQPAPATGTGVDTPLSKPEPTRQGESGPTDRCLNPGDPGYDINNGAPNCNPSRTTDSGPAATTQPQPASPP